MKTALPTFAVLFLAAGLLAGCAGAPMMPAESYEGRSEKATLAVLRNVEADDSQREKILASFDHNNPTMLKLDEQWADLTRQWNRLNRTDAQFLSDAEALSTKRMDVAKQQIVAAAAFEHDVAAVLTPAQWKDWQELWALVGDEKSFCGPGGRRGGGGGGGGGGRRR